MKESYRGREQTYLKHFFLEHYLERVGYVIGMTHRSLVYVDGFSGPWQSTGEDFEDTSFMIAIRKLRQVREGIAKRGRSVDIRCVFVEKDSESFAALQQAVGSVTDLTIKAIPGEFENLIPEILEFIGPRFSLTFIDPTGWKGFALNRIAPILKHSPGEVLINYMTDFMNRFSDLPGHSQAFSDMMGGPGFEGLDEVDKLEFYCERVRETGGFAHVTSTKIKKPTSDRSYFHLIYGTRHVKGLEEFRCVEEREIEEQEKVRLEAMDFARLVRSSQQTLFAPEALAGRSSFEQEMLEQKIKATDRLNALLDAKGWASYEDVLRSMLELPLVWEKVIKQIINEQQEAGRLKIEGPP
jgi:three-Cys-motif partner protein